MLVRILCAALAFATAVSANSNCAASNQCGSVRAPSLLQTATAEAAAGKAQTEAQNATKEKARRFAQAASPSLMLGQLIERYLGRGPGGISNGVVIGLCAAFPFALLVACWLATRQEAPPAGEEQQLTLGQRLAIALVPATVPALVLLLALGLAVGIGALPKNLNDMFEQIAGGALLITYMKELFPKVMEQGDAAVAAMSKGASSTSLMRIKIFCTCLMIGSISASVVAQAAAAGFPGMNDTSGRSESEKGQTFTPASTIAYFVGFFVDGVVLAYDDTPVRCDITLVKKLVMSCVFAIDNLLDGFGLVPVLKEAFGNNIWYLIFPIFSFCVFAGGACTAFVRHFVPSPVFQLCYLSLATTSILVGALQLTSNGLSVYVMMGVAAVWLVLFVGDLVSDEDDEAEEDDKTTLRRRSLLAFVNVAKSQKAQSRWRTATAAALLAGAGPAGPDGPEITKGQSLAARLKSAAHSARAVQ